MKVSFPIDNVGDNVGENVGEKPLKLNNTQKRIIELIQIKGDITQIEIGEQLNITTRTVGRNMKKLQDSNIITRVGSDTQGYWKVEE